MRQASKRIPESAEKTVRDIRRATRRHHSAEEKIRIVLEGLRGEDSIAELCRKEGINQNLYYRWSKEFLEAGKKRLAGDTARSLRLKPTIVPWRSAGVLRKLTLFAELQNSILQFPDAGEPQHRGSGIEPVILPDQHRHAPAVAICLPGCSGKFWWRLDDNGEGTGTDGDRGGDCVRLRSNDRYGAGRLVSNIEFVSVPGSLPDLRD